MSPALISHAQIGRRILSFTTASGPPPFSHYLQLARVAPVKMPSEVSDIKQFIEICRRKDASCAWLSSPITDGTRPYVRLLTGLSSCTHQA